MKRLTGWLLVALVAAGLFSARSMDAQVKLSGMTRSTTANGLGDSALTLVTDTAVRTRAATVAQMRKALAIKAFDSLLAAGVVRPGSDNAVALGTSAFRWSDVRANTATFSGAVSTGALTASSVTSSNQITAGNASQIEWSGRSKLFSDADGQVRATNTGQTGPAYIKAGFAESAVDTTITTTVSYSPNYTTKSFQGITLSANTTQTIGAPTAPTGASATILTHVFIRIKNTSGGSITNAVVWNAAFHFASATAPANPANGTHYMVEFLTDGTTYWELTRSIAIAN